MSPQNIAAVIGATALMGLMSACASTTAPVSQDTVAVTVEVTYRERIALTPGHTLTVSVDDVSLADAPSVPLVKQTLPLDRGVPVKVTLQVPADQINSRHIYAARASIHDSQGRLRFVTDTRTEVLTRGAGNTVSIIMVSTQ